MAKPVNSLRRMAELYKLAADGVKLQLKTSDGSWESAAVNSDAGQSISIFIGYRVKPLNYYETLEQLINTAQEISGNMDEVYEHIFDAGIQFNKDNPSKG